MSWLLVAAATTIFIAAAHSYLGERRIFPRLLNGDDPPTLGGSPALMRSIVRWAWHLTSFAWVALAAILISLLGDPSQLRQSVGVIVAAYLGIGAIVTFRYDPWTPCRLAILSGGRGFHMAWYPVTSNA